MSSEPELPTESFTGYELVCVLKHKSFREINIYPYICKTDPGGFLIAKGRVGPDETVPQVSGFETAVKIASLAVTIETASLAKRFSKSKIKASSFFDEADKKYLDSVVQPFIDSVLSEIISLIIAGNFRLFYHQHLPNLYPADAIQIEQEKATARLRFVRTGSGTIYELTALHKGTVLKLTDPENFIFSYQPCRLLYGSQLILFDDAIRGKMLLPFLKKQTIDIPQRIENEYFSKFIRRLVARCEIEAEGFVISNSAPDPKPMLLPAINWRGVPVLELTFIYGEKEIKPTTHQPVITTMFIDENGFGFSRIKRNLKKEKQFVSALQQSGLESIEGGFALAGNQQQSFVELMEWLIQNLNHLTETGFLIQQQPGNVYLLAKGNLSSSLKSDNDWFDLNAEVIAGDYCFPFFRLRSNILSGKREYQLPSGEIFIIPELWMTEYQPLMRFSEENNGEMRIRKQQFMLLQPFRFPDAEALFSLIQSPGEEAEPRLANVHFRPYQLEGYRRMKALMDRGFGLILADDMGLGKTLQVIAVLADQYPEKSDSVMQLPPSQPVSAPARQLDLFAEPLPPVRDVAAKPAPAPAHQNPASLVAVPASLIHNWLFEIKRFAPWLRCHLYTGSNRMLTAQTLRSVHIILTTYGTLRNDIDKLEKMEFGCIVLDESQQIKNHNSTTASAVFRLKCKNRIAMSGTPIENSLMDLWSQMQFANPGMLGSHRQFQSLFAGTQAAKSTQEQLDKLRAMIAPFIIRRTKADVAPELPPVTESVAWCTMTESQQLLYEREKSGMRNLLFTQLASADKELPVALVLRSLMRLRQIACHPAMTGNETEADSGKFEEAVTKLESIAASGKKVLVFSSFVRHLKLYEHWCQSNDIGYAMLTGATLRRDEVVNSFKNNEQVKVFLISLKAGGVGLNLPEAEYVFLLDPWWNPAAESQAINRAHRIGQDKSVFVYRFISSGSVEEKILRLQERKRKLAQSVISDDTFLQSLTAGELKEMLE